MSDKLLEDAIAAMFFLLGIALLGSVDWRIGLGAFLVAGHIHRQLIKQSNRILGKIK